MQCCCDCCDGLEVEDLTNTDDAVNAAPVYFAGVGKSIQHPLKAATAKTHADAFLCSKLALGVADGVSSVEDEGLNPSELPLEVLRLCVAEKNARKNNRSLFDAETEELAASCGVDFVSSEFPTHILSRAAAGCRSQGSTTCLLGILDGVNLWCANVGDSRMMVVRRTATPPKKYPDAILFDHESCTSARSCVPDLEVYGGYQIVFTSKPQEHFFNCPYQVTRMRTTDCSYEGVFRRTMESADLSCVEVKVGDIVIAGSDGFFDNLFDDDILGALNSMCWLNSSPDTIPTTDQAEVVDVLMKLAIQAASPPEGKRQRLTPFSKAAFDSLGRRLGGGKPDDTTIIVAYVASPIPSELKSSAQTNHSPNVSRKSTLKTPLTERDTSIKQSTRLLVKSPQHGKCRVVRKERLRDRWVFSWSKSSSRNIKSWSETSRRSFPSGSCCSTNPAIKASIHAVPNNESTEQNLVKGASADLHGECPSGDR